MFEWFRKRWGLQSILQVIVVLWVFSITGMSFLWLRKPIYDVLNITAESPFWIKASALIVIGIPLYQVLLLLWGALFGQARFFWEFEKKTFRRMFRSRRRRDTLAT